MALPLGLTGREVTLEALARRCCACWAAAGALGLKSCRCNKPDEGCKQGPEKGGGGKGKDQGKDRKGRRGVGRTCRGS